MLETVLKDLFDYQRFERNASLQEAIGEVLDRYACGEPQIVPDDDLAMAAGGVNPIEEPSREPEHDGRGTV